jgi:predicted metal-dependent peptidase
VVDITNNPRYRPLAGILMTGSRKVCDNTPTAYTDGLNEVYGRLFVEGLSDAELRFLMLHENYHKLYRHLTTWLWMFENDADTANKACDYFINCKLVKENKDGFAVMPSCGLIDMQYDGMDSAAIYHAIRKQGQGQQSNGQGQQSNGQGQQSNGQGQQSNGQGQQSNGQGQQSKPSMDQHDWQAAKGMSEAEVKAINKTIDQALRQGALLAGKSGTGMHDRDMLDMLQPQVNWREVLRDFLSATCAGNDYSTWKRPNRRYLSLGMYMPSGVSESMGELVVAMDTSCSISQHVLSMFVSEVAAICDTVKPERVRVLYWDTAICAEEVYEKDQISSLSTSTKPKGGGGTVVSCVHKHIEEKGIKPAAVLVLTDGYLGGNWGTWGHPPLWCIVNNTNAKPTNGKVVHIKN